MTDESHDDDHTTSHDPTTSREPRTSRDPATSPDADDHDPLDEITAELDALDEPDWGGPEWVSPPLPMEDRLWRHPSEVRLDHAPATTGPRSSLLTLIGVAVGAGLIGALVSAVVVSGLDDDPAPVIERRIEASASTATGFGGFDVTVVAAQVSPAVVRIAVVRSGDERANGSGVVFRSDGLVLTNAHVVRDAVDVEVTLADGRRFDAGVLGIDPQTDIAVLDVDAASLPTVAIAAEPQLAVGQPALAVGSPLGLEGGPTVTSGVISALGRNLASPTGQPLYDLIQTDAPIAPGSSGGALVDANGALIGLTTAIGVSEVGAEGLGFATPIGIAYDVAVDLLDDGRVDHAWLGITGQDVGARVDGSSPQGVEVVTVTEGGPAASAGLRSGDVIMTAEEIDVGSMSQLIGMLRRMEPGSTLRLELASGAAVAVELGIRPDLPAVDER